MSMVTNTDVFLTGKDLQFLMESLGHNELKE